MPKVQDQIIRRFAELEAQCRAISLTREPDGDGTSYAHQEQFYAWVTSALNAIQGVFGNESPHYQRFEKELGSINNNYVRDRKLDTFRGIFLGAKSDVDGGHLFALQTSFSGEIF